MSFCRHASLKTTEPGAHDNWLCQKGSGALDCSASVLEQTIRAHQLNDCCTWGTSKQCCLRAPWCPEASLNRPSQRARLALAVARLHRQNQGYTSTAILQAIRHIKSGTSTAHGTNKSQDGTSRMTSNAHTFDQQDCAVSQLQQRARSPCLKSIRMLVGKVAPEQTP